MAEALLSIDERDESRQAQLNHEGTIIGRSPRCDVVIDSKDVSREHARVFQDPFGRWVFEDLGSSNGTFVNGKRVEASAVLPGELVAIGPACLSVIGPADHQVEADDSVQTTNMIIEDFETEIFSAKGRTPASDKPCPDQLDDIIQRLSQLTNSAALYPEVCRRLAWMPKTVATVLRVPGAGKSLPKTPDVLACHFGLGADDTMAPAASGAYPSHLAFRISHRVLEEVRSTGEPVMAKSIYSSDVEVTITVVDEHSPRAAICAPLGEVAGTIDLLYLDIPLGGAMSVSPEETFAFVAAVAAEVASARKNLTPIQIKAERSTLDHELSLAQQIQTRLAPTVPGQVRGLDVAVSYKPVIWAGGDYCDVWKLEDGRLAFAIGHVSARGLPAAMAISELRTLLRTTVHFSSDLAEAVNHVNSHLLANSLEGISTPLFLAVLDGRSGQINYINAGIHVPVLVHPKSGIRPFGEKGPGTLGDPEAVFAQNQATIPPGLALVAFSKGVTTALSPEGEQFGEKRLTHLLKTTAGRSAEKIAVTVTDAVTDFRKSLAQKDDMTTCVFVNRG